MPTKLGGSFLKNSITSDRRNFLANNGLARRVNYVNLENMLGEIKSNGHSRAS